MNTSFYELDIEDSNFEITPADDGDTEVPILDNNFNYSKVFHSFLLPNKPCLINNATKNWSCASKWIQNGTLNVNYFMNEYSNAEVPISNCDLKEFNVQKKCKMKLTEYLAYWLEYKKKPGLMECLYLKDWHFVKEYPREEVYRVPHFFASDWLNEYYDRNPILNDDYRFVYIGPKGSWTPFHSDVFTSYSWSVNICGRKKWILVPPGKEIRFRDSSGNIKYDLDPSELKVEVGKGAVIEVIQEKGQALFVPSGWYHQVWNLEDTISINHNWVNGCNVHQVWESLKKSLSDVMKEISDCKDMDGWTSQCQLVLSASFGIDYRFFHAFLVEIAERRIKALKTGEKITVFGNYSFGENHVKFDLKRALLVLNMLEEDENFLELVADENSINHSVELLDSLNNFCQF